MKESSGWVVAATVGLSIAAHGATLVGMEKIFYADGSTITAKARQVQKERESAIPIQFVEAPPQILPDTPKPTQKIAERDSVSRDTARDKDPDSLSPALAIGPTDQLAQRRGKPSPPPSLAQAASEARQAVPPAQNDSTPAEVAQAPSLRPQQAAEATPPKTEVKGLTGHDKISTEEMAKLKARARFTGMSSFEATGSGMGEYMKDLKERIWLAWYPYLVFKYPSDFKTADAVLSLTIDKNGNLTIVKLVGFEGSSLFATFCVESVQRAAPFKKLPEEILALLGKDEIELLFAFHYR
jgi:hypothetical protein